jgi:hypothetical protein
VPVYSTDSLRPVPVPCELICRSYGLRAALVNV